MKSTKLTPLMLAASFGHLTIAQLLINKGADPNMLNVLRQTALDMAIVYQQRELELYLTPLTQKYLTTGEFSVRVFFTISIC